MEIKTEVGKILQKLDYVDSQVKKFDDLAVHLYTIPNNEREELLSTLMWYCGVMEEDGTVKDNFKWRINHCKKLLTE